MSAPAQRGPEAASGGEAAKRSEEEEGGRGAAELQRRRALLHTDRLRPGNRRSSHRLFKDLLVNNEIQTDSTD